MVSWKETYLPNLADDPFKKYFAFSIQESKVTKSISKKILWFKWGEPP